jgi:N-methylhydantoinase A
MDPQAFLGGRRELNQEKATQTLQKSVAEPLGFDIEEAAAAVYEIAVDSMSNAIRNVTIEEGRDPADFSIVAYGGALPMFVGDICARLGIRRAIIPKTAPVFSAFGLLHTDEIQTLSGSVFWEPGDNVEKINDTLNQLENDIRADLKESGFTNEQIDIQREGRFKFKGQLFDHPVELPHGELTNEDLSAIRDDFPDLYESEYGPGTAWVDSPIILRAVRVTGVGRTKNPEFRKESVDTASTDPMGTHDIYLPIDREMKEVEIYNVPPPPGATIQGPAVIQEGSTTVYVPVGAELMTDEHNDFVLTPEQGRTEPMASQKKQSL